MKNKMLKIFVLITLFLSLMLTAISISAVVYDEDITSDKTEVVLKAIKREYESDYVFYTFLEMHNTDADYACMIIAVDESDHNHIKMDYWACTIYSDVIDLDKFKTEFIN